MLCYGGKVDTNLFSVSDAVESTGYIISNKSVSE